MKKHRLLEYFKDIENINKPLFILECLIKQKFPKVEEALVIIMKIFKEID